jgi:23S rRNA (cytosine1962-C5)-methyltransferase
MRPLRCILKAGKEKVLLGRHPWVYSGAIDQIDDGFTAGDVVKVFSADQKFLGLGYVNPRSQIAVRMLAFDDVSINEGFFEKRIGEAVNLRRKIIPPDTDTYRVIHSEGDFLPGLIADRYGDYLVLEFLTAGMDRWKETVVRILARELPVRGIFEKDDSEWREAEGLEKRVGKLWGEDPPDFVEIRENGVAFIADIHGGQKTGFFIDQRDNRKLVGGFAKDRRVLNAFCYTGAFTVYAAAGGAAQSVSADISEVAINTARVHFQKNGLDESSHTLICEDVFEYLRSSRQEFDMIILDPPAFCKNQHQLQSASRGYKDINLYALKRLAPGGLLFTASCSSHVTPELFQKIVFGAAKDARRSLRILQKTAHAPDHPVNIYHPEGEYLKGLLCEVE